MTGGQFFFALLIIIVLISAYLIYVKHYSVNQLLDVVEYPVHWIMTPSGAKAVPAGAASPPAGATVITSPTTGKPVVVVPAVSAPAAGASATPVPVPTPAPVIPTASGAPYTRVGCFHDSAQQTGVRSMPSELADLNPWNASKCNDLAKAQGFKYFARQYGTQCWGGNDHGSTPATNCNFQGGDGAWANEVYQTA